MDRKIIQEEEIYQDMIEKIEFFLSKNMSQNLITLPNYQEIGNEDNFFNQEALEYMKRMTYRFISYMILLWEEDKEESISQKLKKIYGESSEELIFYGEKQEKTKEKPLIIDHPIGHYITGALYFIIDQCKWCPNGEIKVINTKNGQEEKVMISVENIKKIVREDPLFYPLWKNIIKLTKSV